MRTMARGEKAKLADLEIANSLSAAVAVAGPAGETYDVSCFGVDSAGQLSDDRFFVFYNQREAPGGAIEATGAAANELEVFEIDLSKLPATIEKLVFTVTIDGSGTMSGVDRGYLRLSSGGEERARYAFAGSDFAAEKALIVAEIYRKDEWRFAAVGQGFNGGLSALLAHFGGEEAGDSGGDASAGVSTPAPPPPPVTVSTLAPPPPPPTLPSASKSAAGSTASSGSSVNLGKVALDKKMEEKAPHLLSLAKKAEVSLAKRDLMSHRAKVALCLDISASMHQLYKSGKIQRFAEKVLALGTRFDDDGAIDVFLFGAQAHEAGEMRIENASGFVDGLLQKHRLEGGTYYGKALQLIRQHYFPAGGGKKVDEPAPAPLPVYVMFLTDGMTGDERQTTEQITWSAHEPIFWQLMAIGKSKNDKTKPKRRGLLAALLPDADFSFLERLDEMGGRYLDNANFFSLEDPEAADDEELYELMLDEYPNWVREARAKGLITG